MAKRALFRKTCLEQGCDKPIYRKRYMRCKEHHAIKYDDERAKIQATRAIKTKSIPTAYRKWRNIENGTAFPWKAGVLYGKGRL